MLAVTFGVSAVVAMLELADAGAVPLVCPAIGSG